MGRHLKFASSDFGSSARGAAFLEAAIGIVPLVLLLLIVVDLLRLGHVWVSGQYAVSKAARWAAYGETLAEASRTDSVKAMVAQNAGIFGVTIGSDAVRVCPVNQPECEVESIMLPGDLFSIKATAQLKLLVSFGGTCTLVFRAIGKNEEH